MTTAAYAHFTLIRPARQGARSARGPRLGAPAQVAGLMSGAGERIRTADLPFTRRPLCLLSYTGDDSVHGSPPRP
jgi:hypothetical protein